MSSDLQIDLRDFEKQVQKLLTFEHALKDKTEEALDQGVSAVLNRLRTTFRQEQDPEGKPWVPSKAGAARKKAGTGQTLFDTGELFHSIQFSKTGEGERVISTDRPYARGLQEPEGSGIARVFLAFSNEHLDLVSRIFIKKLKELNV